MSLEEASDDLDENHLPSQALFTEIIQGISDGNYKHNWVFYVHGFNQSFREALDASYRIAQRYKGFE